LAKQINPATLRSKATSVASLPVRHQASTDEALTPDIAECGTNLGVKVLWELANASRDAAIIVCVSQRERIRGLYLQRGHAVTRRNSLWPDRSSMAMTRP
jgi:hypothetical protein